MSKEEIGVFRKQAEEEELGEIDLKERENAKRKGGDEQSKLEVIHFKYINVQLQNKLQEL